MSDSRSRLVEALESDDACTRLKAALAIGSDPRSGEAELLVARCAVEPDFYVRDMLTWALTRLPAAATVPVLLEQLRAEIPQARSQALHTLSKIRDARAWPAITRALLRDADEEVARSAWRAAVILVPADQKAALARELAMQLGRGDSRLQLSLSRALVCLGAEVIDPVLHDVLARASPAVRQHARATQRLLRDPDAGFDLDVREARRVFVLSKER